MWQAEVASLPVFPLTDGCHPSVTGVLLDALTLLSLTLYTEDTGRLFPTPFPGNPPI